MTPELTLVVVAWNSAELLPESLAAFRASAEAAGVASEVVVVDNASRDGSADVAREAGADVVIENPLNAGFVVAASQGIARARSDWILLANPDLRVELPFVGAVTEATRTAPADVGSLVPDIRFASDPSIVNSRGLVVDELGIPAEREAGLRAEALAAGDVFGASSSASILRVDALRRVGGLEPAYFAYLEDVDVAWRLRRAGYRAALVENAVAVHEGSASTGEGSWLKTFLVARNRRILFRLHAPRTARARALRTVFEVGHASVQAVSGGRDASVRGRFAALGSRRYTRGVAAAERATPALPVPLAPRFTLLESLRRKQTASLLMHGATQPARGRVRVLVDAANLKPGQGGIRTYTLGLIRALAADERLALTVAASAPEIGAVEGGAVVELDPSTRSVVGRALWREQKLPMLVRSTRADVLVAPVPELPFRRIQVPTIAVVHDVGPLVAPAFYTPNKRLRYVATLRHACRRAATIVCVSNSTLVGLRGALGADVERCVVIGEGPQALAVPPTSVAAADPFVLYVGSLDARKNVDTLVRAFAEAEPALPVRLIIVGPTERDEVARLVGVRGDDRVEHRGFVTPEELANLYASCTAVALPSLYEGFGLPVLEAFVAGAPVVVSDIPAAREVAGDAALYVSRPLDPACWREQLGVICGDSERREQLRSAGAAVAGSHTWPAVGTAFADVIVANAAARDVGAVMRAESAVGTDGRASSGAGRPPA
jgi:glycosyltransferase involved in cell wall biosynthesis/GT2 family glycosyltransferase